MKAQSAAALTAAKDELPAAQAEVAAATIAFTVAEGDLAEAEAALENAPPEATPEEIAALELAVAEAKVAVTVAEGDLEEATAKLTATEDKIAVGIVRIV